MSEHKGRVRRAPGRDDWMLVVMIGVAILVVGGGGVYGLIRAWTRMANMPVGRIGAAALIVAAAVAVCYGLFVLFDAAYQRWRGWQRDDVHIASERMRSKISILRPDAYGRMGVSYDGAVYRDLDTLAAYTQATDQSIKPILEEMRWQHAKLQAISHAVLPQTYHVEHITGDTLAPGTGDAVELPAGAELPRRVPLRGLLDGAPSWRRLVLGVAQDNGQNFPVVADLADLVHVAVGGSSGWGKSVFLRSCAYQLARSADPCELALIDLEGATLAPFANSDRLLWPVADTEHDAAVILAELTGELDRRKGLFAAYPGADSLNAYNARSGEQLTPCVCIVDEATALLENKDIEEQLRTLTLRARKYGLWLWLAGQDWKSTTLDTAIRNQLATRVQFKAMSASQSRVLLQNAGAEDLDVKGRAMAWIPGRELLTIQAPYVSLEDIEAALKGNGARRAMPERQPGDSTADKVRDLWEAGQSLNAIQRSVFGYVGGAAYEQVKAILPSTTTTQASPDTLGGTDIAGSSTVGGEQ